MVVARFLLAITVFGCLISSDMLHAISRVYDTRDSVLSNAFPEADIEKKTVKITPEMRREIETITKDRLFRRRFSFLVAKEGGKILGYASEVDEIGKTEPITFMVVLNRDGMVRSVNLLVYRETQGHEIANPQWRKQFEGKSLSDPLRLKKDIDSITGATMSSRAVTKGVKKVLAVFQVVRELLDE
jgi:Na+-translocating ferredoxin:NAD+ oxidoreductase RnfG subunit